MAGQVTLKCFECSSDLSFPSGVGRRDECESCGADVHVCRNCKFFDPSSYNECREPSADQVKEKDRANFCEYFEAGDGVGGNKKKNDVLAAAEALFRKK